MKKQEESTVINTAENNSQQNIEENHLQQNGKVDNTLIWIQAFMPLLGALFIGGTVATFLINSVILYFDCEKLKKQDMMWRNWGIPGSCRYIFIKGQSILTMGKDILLSGA